MNIQKLLKFFKPFSRAQNKSDLTNEQSDTKAYSSLAPVSDPDAKRQYSDILLWALTNDRARSVKNIAITGVFGSGKSSILKTFQETHMNQGFNFLNVSLATFKEETDTKCGNVTKGPDLVRLIEISILQQMFYQEDIRTVPDSRFKRIKSYSRNNIALIATAVMFFMFSFAYLSFPNLVTATLRWHPSNSIDTVVHFFSLGICIFILFLFLQKVIRSLTRVRLSKLTIQDAEFELSDDVSKSILNNHIDEILYFFEVTEYNVVIFEDLDRFQETEIFTKLREINLILNRSRKINRKIAFIYAVRDDMFQDRDRTKFFDLIIPVIPIINFSNSKEILLQKCQLGGLKLSERLLDDISLFIDDMRLLNNIVNEYILYRNNLDAKLNQDKLFAMVCYKNLYPSDFALLSNNQGDLYSVITLKRNFLESENKTIDTQIFEQKIQLKHLEYNWLQSVTELRKVYLFTFITALPNFLAFFIEGRKVSATEALSNEYFMAIQSNNVQYYIPGNYGNQLFLRDCPVDFTSIASSVLENVTLEQRIAILEKIAHNGIDEVKRTIQALENRRKELKSCQLSDLMRQGKVELSIKDFRKKQVIHIFIQSGYISEDYLDYISYFYEGSLTKSDYQFLINIKTKTFTDFSFKLNHIANLVAKIDPIEFQSSNILNLNLLDFLLSNNGNEELIQAIFKVLSDESAISIQFIDSFLNDGIEQEQFIKKLCDHWPNIWIYVDEKSSMSDEQKNEYFYRILNFANLESLKNIAEKSSFIRYLSEVEDFDKIRLSNSQFDSLLGTLEVCFKDISKIEVSNNFLRLIYDHSSYVIEPKNLRAIAIAFSKFDQTEFDTNNYAAIKKSGCSKMNGYIDSNLEVYIRNVFLSVQGGNDSEDTVLELLNSTKIGFPTKSAIIEKIQNPIISLKDIENNSVLEALVSARKVVPSWSNIQTLFVCSGEILSEVTLAFLSNDNVVSALTEDSIANFTDKVQNFQIALALSNELPFNYYKTLISCFKSELHSLDIKDINTDRVHLLIELGFITLTKEYYKVIAAVFPELLPLFIKKSMTYFLDEFESFEVTKVDLYQITRSSDLVGIEKTQILARFDMHIIVDDTDLMKTIGHTLQNDLTFTVDPMILFELLRRPILDIAIRITILEKSLATLSRDQIFSILSTLPKPYSQIAPDGRRPVFEFTKQLSDLTEALQKQSIISKMQLTDKEIRIHNCRR